MKVNRGPNTIQGTQTPRSPCEAVLAHVPNIAWSAIVNDISSCDYRPRLDGIVDLGFHPTKPTRASGSLARMAAKFKTPPIDIDRYLKDELLCSFLVSQHCKMEIKWCSYVLNLQLRIHPDRVG